jgi:hypothetical protein
MENKQAKTLDRLQGIKDLPKLGMKPGGIKYSLAVI